MLAICVTSCHIRRLTWTRGTPLCATSCHIRRLTWPKGHHDCKKELLCVAVLYANRRRDKHSIEAGSWNWKLSSGSCPSAKRRCGRSWKLGLEAVLWKLFYVWRGGAAEAGSWGWKLSSGSCPMCEEAWKLSYMRQVGSMSWKLSSGCCPVAKR